VADGTTVAAEPPPSRRKTAFTSRAAVLAVVVAALALALAAPLRQLLTQRAQIASLQSSIASSQKQIAALQKTHELWADPTYVAGQARERLHYVYPGQVPYVTLTPTPVPSASAAAAAALASQPWYGRLWNSVQGATGVRPTPSALPVASQVADIPPVSPAP
jgi:cell division protein FtsB